VPNICSSLPPSSRSFGQPAPEPKRPEPYGQSAPRPHEIANGEIEADEHHERDKPLIAVGGTVRDDKHAAVVDGRRASPQEGAKN
jgi:hypothetical protein